MLLLRIDRRSGRIDRGPPQVNKYTNKIAAKAITQEPGTLSRKIRPKGGLVRIGAPKSDTVSPSAVGCVSVDELSAENSLAFPRSAIPHGPDALPIRRYRSSMRDYFLDSATNRFNFPAKDAFAAEDIRSINKIPFK